MATWAVDGDETMSREMDSLRREMGDPDGTSGSFRGLKHLHDGFNSLHTETTLWITNVQLEGTK